MTLITLVVVNLLLNICCLMAIIALGQVSTVHREDVQQALSAHERRVMDHVATVIKTTLGDITEET